MTDSQSVAKDKKTLVLGASLNPERASNEAIRRLRAKGYEVVAVGGRAGQVAGVPIKEGKPDFEDLHTLSLYLGPDRQKENYDYILELKPRRIIFNPGTENRELADLARERGIEVEYACTLVMLALNSY
jgi:hypothetical protein